MQSVQTLWLQMLMCQRHAASVMASTATLSAELGFLIGCTGGGGARFCKLAMSFAWMHAPFRALKIIPMWCGCFLSSVVLLICWSLSCEIRVCHTYAGLSHTSGFIYLKAYVTGQRRSLSRGNIWRAVVTLHISSDGTVQSFVTFLSVVELNTICMYLLDGDDKRFRGYYICRHF